MSEFELLMPKLGESVQEATITKWFVKEGDKIEEEDPLLEIATDKVDSEIPSPVDGVVSKVFFKENDLVPVGKIIAVISTGKDAGEKEKPEKEEEYHKEKETIEEKPARVFPPSTGTVGIKEEKDERFYSPLVKNIARKEGISREELNSIPGTGYNGRVKKEDILHYLEQKPGQPSAVETRKVQTTEAPKIPVNEGDEVVKMDRMRKIIAEHMVRSKQVSAHVTNFIEVDVTNVVLWRNKVKDIFLNREKEKITYTPVFLEAIAKSLKEYPMINSSVDGENIILRKDINLGVAVALPSGNLIVPVIKRAENLNLTGLTKELNRLAANARNNKLSPDDIQGGTFSVSNFGSFKNLTGTPIINQPQTAIIAIGSIEKKPAVIETPSGDMIGIRHKMFLSLTYDHRVIDGALGGAFLKKVADYIEEFDMNRTI